MMSFSLSGGVEVYGFIAPTEITDEYPVIDPLYGIDGFRNVDTLNDLNNIPTLRRRAGMVVGIGGGTQYYKLNPGPWNGTITDWTIFNSGGGGSGVFTGGTVTGSTNFTNGLTANTLTVNGVSITGDTYTTGGTYSNGTIDFYYNTGGVYQVTGLYTGETSYVNSLTTGVGLSADTTTGNITIINTDPDQVVSISGGTNVDVTGTYPNFNIALTGLSDNNIYTTGFTYSANTFYITDTSGNTFPATIDIMTGLTINGNLNVTGSTTSTTFYGDGSNLTGISRGGAGGKLFYFNISNTQTPYYEFSTSGTTALEQTISASTSPNSTSLIGGFMTPSGVPNITEFPAGILSFYLHTYDDNTNYNFDIYCELYKRTTGGTETLLFTSDPVAVIGNVVSMVISDGYFSGATLNTSDRLVVKVYGTNLTNQTRTIYFVSEGSQHYSFALTTIPTFNDTFVTGFTYSNNTLTIKQNNNQPDLPVTINSVTGLTVNGNLTVTGNTSLQGLTATTINGSSISAPGSTTQVIYNNGGVLSADTGFVYTGNKITLGQSGATTASSGEIILNRFTTGTNVGGIRAEQTGAGIEIGGNSYYDKIFMTNGSGIRFWTYVSGVANTERMRITNGTGTNWGVGINTTTPLATLHVAGTTLLQTFTGTTGLISAATQNVLTIVGSGNTTSSPIFTVQGSSGELFSVSDSLVGSLFSVNDISGLPILEVFSDNTTLMGSYLAPSLNTTARVIATTGTTNVYSIPTSAYTGAFFDYTVSDGTNLRAGNIMSVWSGSSVNYTETQTTDFGNTSGLTFNMVVSSGNAILRTSGTTGNWTVKTIVRSI